MAQLASHRTDTASLSDNVAMIGHVRNVRYERTSVKDVDNVLYAADNRRMERTSTGSILLALKLRAGDPSLDEIARSAGYKGKSSIQKYFNAEHTAPLSVLAAQKLADGFEGKGEPPIQRSDILALTGIPMEAMESSIPVRMDGSSSVRMDQNLPVYGTALGASRISEGTAIEQTELNNAERVEYVKRPTILNGNVSAYGLYVQGDSMSPAHEEGSLILIDAKRPPQIGDDVVVYLRANGEEHEADDGERIRCVLIKRLVRRTAQYVELRQFNPDITFKIESSDVLRIDRVLTLRELLG